LRKQIFIRPLRNANPPIIPYTELDGFIDDVFGNFYDVRRANSQLIEILNVRQREQSLVIQRVGDIFLQVATEFRLVYPPYVGHLPIAEKRLKEEAEGNHEFRLFLEVPGGSSLGFQGPLLMFCLQRRMQNATRTCGGWSLRCS
jgi:hypothetical protein